MQEMLKITGIRKSFSTLDVLKGVDLTVHKGSNQRNDQRKRKRNERKRQGDRKAVN